MLPVWMHAEINGMIYSLVSPWELHGIVQLGWYAIVQRKVDAIFLPTKALARTAPYSQHSGDMFRVIIPLQMR